MNDALPSQAVEKEWTRMDSHHRPSDYKYQPLLLLKLLALIGKPSIFTD